MQLPTSQILKMGEEDNFWSMGEGEGPCGPCTEIFYDTYSNKGSMENSNSLNDENRWIEIWNLVFMQYSRQSDGSLTNLKIPCVDTGMGLERISTVLQGKTNTFDCDAFQKITFFISQLLKEKWQKDVYNLF